MTRILSAALLTLAMAGCVSTPNTKALITPVGAIGIHSFAPAESDRTREVDPDLMAKLEDHTDRGDASR